MTATAAMVALSVVLTRFVGFAPEGTPFRFEIGFLPIAFIGYLFGPLYSGVGYVIADLIGSLLSGYAPYIPITLCQCAMGISFGFFFHRKRLSLLRLCAVFSALTAVIDILLKTPILSVLYGWEVMPTMLLRLYNGLANLPIRIILTYFCARALDTPLKKYMRQTKTTEFKDYANSFQAVTVPGLERICLLCKKLGNPEKRLRFIHIAGTNGKGSVSAYLASILGRAGFTVGKFISPNLIKVNERISIGGRDISDSELEEELRLIEPLSAEVEAELGLAPTQFEIWCAAAFDYFAKRRCDIVVLEVGLGGELDATNVIHRNVAAVITRLGIDHKQYLGDTIEKIAEAKAGIIKADSELGAVFTVEQEPAAMKVIEAVASKKGLRCVVPKLEPLGAVDAHERFSCSGIDNIVCGISGYHQIENASLAAEVAARMGIAAEYIKDGISLARNPARFEIIEKEPVVIYDGGHNENGITALMNSVKRYYGNIPKTVVFACMADKEIDGSLKLLSDGETEFIYTTVKNNPRAASAEDLQAKAASFGYGGVAFEEIGDAYEEARRRGKLVIICGSLYLYRDLREYLDSSH